MWQLVKLFHKDVISVFPKPVEMYVELLPSGEGSVTASPGTQSMQVQGVLTSTIWSHRALVLDKSLLIYLLIQITTVL